MEAHMSGSNLYFVQIWTVFTLQLNSIEPVVYA